MNPKQSAFLLCILLMFVPLTSLPVAAAGPAAQVVITTPSTSISSDGVLQLDATIYDALFGDTYTPLYKFLLAILIHQ